jgi:putative transposase
VFVLDGSSLELEHCRELVKAYPPAENQYGKSHWPVLRVVVLHDLNTGMAEEPHWGPMYGPKAVSEQALAEQALAALPPQAVLIGDRNFGIFATAYAAQQRGVALILRLTKVRAGRLAKGLSRSGERAVRWQPSRWDGGGQHRWCAEAAVEGRLIVIQLRRGRFKEWLYLFTTLDWKAERILELYGRRWNIETDLRSLKGTVRLQHVAAKSSDLLEKELLMAVAAYNLVRAVICLAARHKRLDPRQLSFTQVLNVVHAAWPKLSAAPTLQDHHREFERVLEFAAQCKLPRRSKRRSYPRAIWRRNQAFPFRRDGKNRKSK